MNGDKSNFGRIACGLLASLGCLILIVSFSLYRYVVNSPIVQSTQHTAAGNTYFAARQYKQAITEFTEVIKLLPDSQDGYELRAKTYTKMGQYGPAIADYTRVLDLTTSPEAIRAAHYSRGIDYKQKHAYAKAIEDFDAVLQWNPTEQDAIVTRNDCYRLQGDPSTGRVESETDYHSKLADYLRVMASANSSSNAQQYSNAAAEGSQGIRLNPSDAQGWANLAWTQYLQGHVTTAIKTTKTAIKIDPNLPYIRFNMGIYYAVQGNWDAAKVNYQAGIVYASSTDMYNAAKDISDASARYPDAAATLDKASNLLQEAKTGETNGTQ